jgi:hypothetical protein
MTVVASVMGSFSISVSGRGAIKTFEGKYDALLQPNSAQMLPLQRAKG